MCARLRASWLVAGMFLELLLARCHFGAQFDKATLTEEFFGVGKHLTYLVLDVMLDVLNQDFDLHAVGFVGRSDTRDLGEQTLDLFVLLIAFAHFVLNMLRASLL